MRCLVFCLLLGAAVAYVDVDDAYMSKFVQGADKAALRRYFSCLVDKGPCDDFSGSVKSHMVEVVRTGCEKCDAAQKHYAHFFIRTLRNDFPDLYDAFEDKYDPDRTLLPKVDMKVRPYWR